MWWYLLLILPALIIILLFLPIYLSVEMRGDEPEMKLHLGFINITRLVLKESDDEQKTPAESGRSDRKKPAQSRAAKRKSVKRSLSEKIEAFKEKTKLVYDISSEFVKRVSVRSFRIRCRVSTGDAAETAVLYGAACAALAAVNAFVDEKFNVKKQSVYVYPDFTETSSKLEAYIRIRIFVFSVLGAGIRIIINSMRRKEAR